MISVQKSIQPRRQNVALGTNATNQTLRQGWRLAAAGGMAGMVTNTILHPLDTVKTVRQSDPRRFPGVAPTIMAIIRNRGPLALYAGIVPALIGSALSSALYFGTYELAKKRITQLLPQSGTKRSTRVPVTAISAACGNIASSILFVPKEVVKQRMQAGTDGTRFLNTAVNLLKTSGLAGLYKGYRATLLRNIPSTMIRFAVYEEIKLLLRRSRSGSTDKSLSTTEFIAAGSVAGAFSSACTTPMDVLKTRFATGKIKSGTGIISAFKHIVDTEGAAGLFVGIRPRTVWAALFAAIGFTSYEICKGWALGNPHPLLAPKVEIRPTTYKQKLVQAQENDPYKQN